MDWSIPRTFYPSGLPAIWMWVLFVIACLATVFASAATMKSKGLAMGLVLVVPIAMAMLVASMMLSMVVMFFVHDV